MSQSESEKIIQRDIQLALGAEPDLLLMRNAVGFETRFNDAGERRSFHFGLGKGSPDLVGILAPRGMWVCLEVKDHDGTLSADQKTCHEAWRRFGAFVAVVRSVKDARFALAEARRACRVTASQAPAGKGKR